jgi:hydrogenase maturation protease
MSPHDPALVEVLSALELSGHAPGELVLVGVVPKNVEQGIGLSGPVKEAIPAAVDAVVEQLRRFGVAMERKTRPEADREEWWAAP